MDRLQSEAHLAYRSLVKALQLQNIGWGVETLLTQTRQLLNIDDSVHQATIAEVARDPEVRALRSGQLPPPSLQSPTLMAQLGSPGGLASPGGLPPGAPNGAVSPQLAQNAQLAKQRMAHGAGAARRQMKPAAAGMHVPAAAAQAPIQTGTPQGVYGAAVSPHQQRMHAPGHRVPPHLMAHPSMAPNGASPPSGFRASAPGHSVGRATPGSAGTPVASAGGPGAGRSTHGKRPSEDTASTTAGAPSGVSGGGGVRGAKKGKPARQRALEQACPANLRDKINEVELQGLVIERHWEREGWCRGIIAHSVKRKGGAGYAYHIIYDLDSTTTRPSWELSVPLSTSQAGEKWRIPNPPLWVSRNWKDVVPPTSGKKTGKKAAEAQRPAAAAAAAPAAKPVSTLHPGVTFGASARGEAAPAATPAAPAPAPAPAPAAGRPLKRPPPAAGGVRPPPGDGSVPRAIPEEEIYAACREAEATGNNAAVLQLLEAIRARRDFLCDCSARHKLGTLLASVGPSRARKHLEKELLENRAKQRRLAEELG